MAEQTRIIVASREFSTEKDRLTLRILASPDGSASFGYQILDGRGELMESLETFGVDSLQALLFCITAAGDYLSRYEPTASFADLGVTAMLMTDLTTPGQWKAQVSMPTGPL